MGKGKVNGKAKIKGRVNAKVNGKARAVARNKAKDVRRDKAAERVNRRAADNRIRCKPRSDFRAWGNRAAVPVRDVAVKAGKAKGGKVKAVAVGHPGCTVDKGCRDAGQKADYATACCSLNTSWLSKRSFLTTIRPGKVSRKLHKWAPIHFSWK